MSIFMAGVQKLDGRSGYEVSERLGAFTIMTVRSSHPLHQSHANIIKRDSC